MIAFAVQWASTNSFPVWIPFYLLSYSSTCLTSPAGFGGTSTPLCCLRMMWWEWGNAGYWATVLFMYSKSKLPTHENLVSLTFHSLRKMINIRRSIFLSSQEVRNKIFTIFVTPWLIFQKRKKYTQLGYSPPPFPFSITVALAIRRKRLLFLISNPTFFIKSSSIPESIMLSPWTKTNNFMRKINQSLKQTTSRMFWLESPSKSKPKSGYLLMKMIYLIWRAAN